MSGIKFILTSFSVWNIDRHFIQLSPMTEQYSCHAVLCLPMMEMLMNISDLRMNVDLLRGGGGSNKLDHIQNSEEVVRDEEYP
jgi:hypothetical protein